MHIIVVTPLIRGTHLESLSYFSATPYDIGSFLQVPIRGKDQPAVVTAVRSATASKISLKSASFSLRKLPVQTEVAILPAAVRDTAATLTELYPATTGAMLQQLLPPDVRTGTEPYPITTTTTTNHTLSDEPIPEVLTAPSVDRHRTYQSLIRSAFATQTSVIVVVPSASYIASLAAALGTGITNRVVVFSPTQTKRQRAKAYAEYRDTSQAKVVITTPSHAYLVREDISTIIVEHAGSSQYIARVRPYLDHRIGLKQFAHQLAAHLLLGDSVPSTEDEHKRREGDYETHGANSKRVAFTAPLTFVTTTPPTSQTIWQLFAPQTITAIRHTLENNGTVFLYAARRGLAPMVCCLDCSYIFRCPDSGAPYSLVRIPDTTGEEVRWFISSASGRRLPAADTCAQCGSWRLRERGVGIQHVADEWCAQFPDTPPVIIDHTTTKTVKAVQKASAAFQARTSGVLIGTQLALPHLDTGVDLSVVMSLDATRATPTWRADESLFRLLLRLRECSRRDVLVQARTQPTDDPVLQHASRGALERFYDDELSVRQQVSYPPFTTFILLTWTGSADNTKETETHIKQLLPAHAEALQCYNSPHSTRAQTTRHGLLRVPAADSATYRQLLDHVRRLPPYIKVEVNPERIV